ncbi:MAG: bifunctional diaminohydroxyphosphoribosylaminopyrimidine deaminase/5-amino-6-(5-phosphoribosylamino)uracil reductase RibD [Fermentimonas sp.]|nr:bifunctional diaminohydroxyphosphoribosylaminopyrimidine deaminase/5-amino-6-(5-phosphoribosylamino)uracil reductase RibD [Fermentimonas sp.]
MQRCLFLARKSEGFTKSNPMVGAVIVHENKIIGEGYHRQFGEAHAEVNAINSVKNKSLLQQSTMYVSLEPCAHQGKTPPCAELIIKHKIPRVAIAVRDPNPKVSGKGVAMMIKSGIDIEEGLMEEEAMEINRFFFVNQLLSRPYVILKWAQSKDGFIDLHRKPDENKAPVIISNKITHSIVHKYRTRVQGILVGTNTAILDNPKLTARKWFGDDPIRIVIDKSNKIPLNSSLLDGSVPTIIFTAAIPAEKKDIVNLKFIEIDFSKDTNLQILDHLYRENIYSILIEGGSKLLSSFIEKNLWDEALIEVSEKRLLEGIKSPEINGYVIGTKRYLNSAQYHLKSKITRNFL